MIHMKNLFYLLYSLSVLSVEKYVTSAVPPGSLALYDHSLHIHAFLEPSTHTSAPKHIWGYLRAVINSRASNA